VMDGYRVMPLEKAVGLADVVLSVTGNKNVIDERHLRLAKDGVVLAQAGHFDVEVNKTALKKMTDTIRQVRPFVQEYQIATRPPQKKFKKIYLLAEGRLVNLAAAEGHPASVMDMSFAGQAVAARYMWENRGKLKIEVHRLPRELDENIASLKLKSAGVKIDQLTREQKNYLGAWKEGT